MLAFFAALTALAFLVLVVLMLVEDPDNVTPAMIVMAAVTTVFAGATLYLSIPS